MTSIENLVKLRKQAEEAVEDMTDHELKITAFEVIFEYLLEEIEDEEGDEEEEEEEKEEEVKKPKAVKKTSIKKKAAVRKKVKSR